MTLRTLESRKMSSGEEGMENGRRVKQTARGPSPEGRMLWSECDPQIHGLYLVSNVMALRD
jgi:hypothetical protein